LYYLFLIEAFISIGKVALIVTNSISPYLDNIFASIREGLVTKGFLVF